MLPVVRVGSGPELWLAVGHNAANSRVAPNNWEGCSGGVLMKVTTRRALPVR
jgi:hypothetical protein